MSDMTGDPQFGVFQIMRPYPGFEAQYQGVDVATPIVLTPNGEERDPLAGKPGYTDDLVRGLPCPMGARAIILIPIVWAAEEGGGDVAPVIYSGYTYTFWWRTRNLADYRASTSRSPYHFASISEGASGEIILPGANVSVTYNTSEPTGSVGGTGLQVQRLRPVECFEQTFNASNQVSLAPVYFNRPIMSNGNQGVIQQGFRAIGTNAFATYTNKDYYMPQFAAFELPCLGDELLIGVTRRSIQTFPNWAFEVGVTGVDHRFSVLYGNENGFGQPYPFFGTYVSFGKAST